MQSSQVGPLGVSLAGALSVWHQFPWRLDALLQNVRRRRDVRATARLLGFLGKHLDHITRVCAVALSQGRALPFELRQEHAQMRAYLEVMRKSCAVWGGDEYAAWVTGRLLGNCIISHADKVECALWPPTVARADRTWRRRRVAGTTRCPAQASAGSLS